MPIIWKQSRREKTEVALWLSGQGVATPAVVDAIERNGLTFGAALVTREMSDGYDRN